MKKTITAMILVAMVLGCCAGCGDKTANLTMVEIGSDFLLTSGWVAGDLSYTVNSVQWSDNVKELGVDPKELDFYSSVSYGEEEEQWYDWPDYVDLETGQLAEHLRFVLVEVTVTNIDACDVNAPVDEGGAPDDSWYTFGVNHLSISDLNVQGKNGFWDFDSVWYADTGDYDPQEGGTNGSNYFILWPGESLIYRMGFVIGSSEDDFSRMCLTDGGGSYSVKQAVYISLGMQEAD
jgi:hypothetical protein